MIRILNENGEDNHGLSIFLVLMAFFIDIFSFGLIIPIIPFLVTNSTIDTAAYGGYAAVFAVVVAVYSFTQLIAAPFWGRLSDRIGRRPVILTGLVGSTISFLVIIFFLSVPGMFFSRALQGVFTGATLPTVRAYIADISTEENITQRYGMLGSVYGLGFATGPSIGGLLAGKHQDLAHLMIPMGFAAALTFLNFVGAFIYLIEPESQEERMKERADTGEKLNLENISSILSLPAMAVLFVVFLAMNLLTSSFEVILPLALVVKEKSFTPLAIGLLFLLVGAIVGIVQIFGVPKVSKILSEEKVMTFGFAMMSLGIYLLGYIDMLTVVFVGVLFVSIGIGIAFPTVLSSTTQRLPADQQGIGAGLNEGVGGFGRIAGPLIAGFIYTATGITFTFKVLATFMFAITALSYVGIKPLHSHNRQVSNLSAN